MRVPGGRRGHDATGVVVVTPTSARAGGFGVATFGTLYPNPAGRLPPQAAGGWQAVRPRGRRDLRGPGRRRGWLAGCSPSPRGVLGQAAGRGGGCRASAQAARRVGCVLGAGRSRPRWGRVGPDGTGPPAAPGAAPRRRAGSPWRRGGRLPWGRLGRAGRRRARPPGRSPASRSGRSARRSRRSSPAPPAGVTDAAQGNRPGPPQPSSRRNPPPRQLRTIPPRPTSSRTPSSAPGR